MLLKKEAAISGLLAMGCSTDFCSSFFTEPELLVPKLRSRRRCFGKLIVPIPSSYLEVLRADGREGRMFSSDRAGEFNRFPGW